MTDQACPALLDASTAATWLSETRALKLSPAALNVVNSLLSEILHSILVAAAVLSPPATSDASFNLPSSPVPRRPRTADETLSKPLAQSEIISRHRFKAATLAILGSSLGNGAVVEAEVALRELLQRGPPSLRSDGALKRYGGPVGRCSELTVAQKDDMHRSLRLYVGLLSSAAQHSPSLDSYISSVLSLPTPLIPRNDHVTFITAFYAERILDFVSQTVVRRIGRILERDSSKDSASVEDVVLALAEDDSLWIWEEKAQGFLGKARLSTGRSSQITMFEGASSTSFDKLLFSTAPKTKKISLTPSFFSRQDLALRSRNESSTAGQFSPVVGRSDSKPTARKGEEAGLGSAPMSHQESYSSGTSTLGRNSDGDSRSAEGRSGERTGKIKGFLAKVTTRRSAQSRPSTPIATNPRPLERFPSSNGILVAVGSESPTFSTAPPPLPPTPSRLPPTPTPVPPLARIRQPLPPIRPPPFIRSSRSDFPPTSIRSSIAESVPPNFANASPTPTPVLSPQRTTIPLASPSTRANIPSPLLSTQSTTAPGILSRTALIEEVHESEPMPPSTPAKKERLSAPDNIRVLKRGASYRSASDAATKREELEQGDVSAVDSTAATTRQISGSPLSAASLLSASIHIPSSLPHLQELRLQMASATTAQECRRLLDKLIQLTQTGVDSPPISPVIPASVPFPSPTLEESAELAEKSEQPTDSTQKIEEEHASEESEARDLKWVVEMYLG